MLEPDLDMTVALDEMLEKRFSAFGILGFDAKVNQQAAIFSNTHFTSSTILSGSVK